MCSQFTFTLEIWAHRTSGTNKATQNPVNKLYFSILQNSPIVPYSIKANFIIKLIIRKQSPK